MAQAKAKAASASGDHDRVAMLSLRADGSHDQLNPEIVGGVDFAREAARRQFVEQAVSAADSATPAEHEKVAAAAEKAAVAAVNALKG